MLHQAFNAHPDEYDAWYDSEAGKAIFAMEVDCLQPLLHSYKRPYLEIGVGSGRFAQDLGIEYGVDPALALLRIADFRGIRVAKATGERLPFREGIFGGVLIALTLCFVNDPVSVLKEAWRVLLPGGGLVLGLILQGSPWEKFYIEKAKQRHPIYSRARFFAKEEVERLLQLSRFEALAYRSVLFQMPGQSTYRPEGPVPGYWESAGFVAIGSCKGEA
jgi:SAM-dependent methyltransferase